RARLVQEVEALAEPAEAHARLAGAEQRPDCDLRYAHRARLRDERLVLRVRLFVLHGLEQRLGACERTLEAAALVGGDAVREEPGVDAEPHGEPFDCLAGRARLAALDLGDVFLGEALARELALRQARGDAELAEALAQAEPGRGGAVGPSCGILVHAACFTKVENLRVGIPLAGHVCLINRSSGRYRKSL